MPFTISTCLSCLYALNDTEMNQVDFMDALFFEYYGHRCKRTGYETPYPQSMASLILRGLSQLPRQHVAFYAGRGGTLRLRSDVHNYLALAAPTAQQRENLYQALYRLASEDESLLEEDRLFLLDHIDSRLDLEQLLYRCLFLAIHASGMSRQKKACNF